jgi:4-hydroxybenzoate polyprenyltransferase
MTYAHDEPDAAPASWLFRFVPDRARPYLRLARLDRPTGIWLLLWPCWWGLALAAPAMHRHWPSFGLMILFGIGAVVMRAAGCVYNDIVDRKIDAQVARTKDRPLASGVISVRDGWIFAIALSLIGLLVLLALSHLAIRLGLFSLLIVAVYPFMKRFTFWPQLVLGLAFNWGALMGFAAETGRLSSAAIFLYLAGIFWTLGYDTIYALQDKEDDALIGVKSTALRFGEKTPQWLFWFYAGTIFFLTWAANAANLGWGFDLLVIPPAAHLLWQITRLDLDDPARCLALFRANEQSGALVFLALLGGSWTAALPPGSVVL